MRKVRVAPKGMGLNDFVAQQEGFFEAEGIEVEFDIKTFRGTQSSWKGLDYKSRPQDKPYAEGDKGLIQCACVWGSISNASAGMGRFVPDCYGVSPWAIFVRPDSKIRKPQDLEDVPVSVGMRAGSHFNVPFRLEKFLPLENIKVVNSGGFGARLRALLDKEVEAASLLPPQIDMARQLGLRMVMEDEFHTLWWVPETADKDDVRAYLNGLQKAEEALQADLQKYLPPLGEVRAAGVQGRAQVGLLEVHARRALRLQADAAQRVRRGHGAGEPLGPRRPPERALVREADLPRLSAEQTAPPGCSPGKEVLMRLIRLY